jgi:hypothetical protein
MEGEFPQERCSSGEAIMKTKALVAILAAFGCVIPLAWSDDTSESTKLDAAQRYTILDTFKVSTMQKELDAAAVVGYRVVTGVGRSFLILEKTTGGEKYEYRLPPPGEKALNQAASDGFRVLRRTLGVRRDTGDVVMEKEPQSTQKYEYRLLDTTRSSTMQGEVDAAAHQGYRVLGITKTNPLGSGMGDRIVVMERIVGQSPIASAASAKGPAEPRFLLLQTTKTGTLQKELDDAAKRGFKVLDASDDELAVFLEKTAQPPDTYEYLVIATTKTSSMEKEVNQAAARGFHVLPQTLSGIDKKLFGAFGGTVQTENVVLMEKSPGDATPRSQYKLLATQRVSTLQKELTAASEDGWALCGAGFTSAARKGGLLSGVISTGERLVFLERPVMK